MTSVPAGTDSRSIRSESLRRVCPGSSASRPTRLNSCSRIGLTAAVCLLLWQSRAVIVRAVALFTACLAAAGIAHASVFIANDAKRPQLAVDAKGYAKITWFQGGAAQTVVVPPVGLLTHGGSI